jgi:hypothetical protein
MPEQKSVSVWVGHVKDSLAVFTDLGRVEREETLNFRTRVHSWRGSDVFAVPLTILCAAARSGAASIAVDMTSALDSSIGLPNRSTRAFRILGFEMPPDVSRSFNLGSSLRSFPLPELHRASQRVKTSILSVQSANSGDMETDGIPQINRLLVMLSLRFPTT